MTVNFSLLALDQILNNAATLRHMSGNQFGVPVVIRMATGAGRQVAAQHSHSLEGWYAHIPGHQGSGARDPRGRARHALDRSGRPGSGADLRERHALQHDRASSRPNAGPVAIDKAAVRRAGTDITLITYGGSLWKTLEAAAALAADGIDAEVIDLRTLRPLDDADHHRLGDQDPTRGHRRRGLGSGSLAAEICARIVEQAFYELDAPIARVCSEEVPIPYARHLEEAAIPQPAKIIAARPPWARWRLMAEFRMPSLGADMEAGTLVEWMVKPATR